MALASAAATAAEATPCAASTAPAAAASVSPRRTSLRVQPLPPALQAAPNRPRRPTQQSGRLLLRPTFAAAEQHRQPVRLGQPGDLLVQEPQEFAGRQGVRRVRARVRRLGPCGRRLPVRRRASARALRATRRATPCSQAASACGRRSEAALRARTRKAAWGSPRRRGRVPQHVPANAQDHRAVPRRQRGKGRLIALAGEAGQQGGVRLRPMTGRRRQAADVADECGGGRRHGVLRCEAGRASPYTAGSGAGTHAFFLRPSRISPERVAKPGADGGPERVGRRKSSSPGENPLTFRTCGRRTAS